MIINHNMNAMNAHRLMSGNTANAGKSMEKLSSGLRINRAGDDAAGLAISEKMRGQIRGLDQASRNSQDGISMIQTAEGALNETHSILQRMRELATQAGNDTNVAVDRTEIQKEMNQLSSEINRIGNTTEFNTQKLLAGDGKVSVEKTGKFTDVTLSGGKTTNTEVSQLVSISTTATAGNTVTFTLNGEEIKVTFASSSSSNAAGSTSDVTSNSVTVYGINAATDTAAALKAGIDAVIMKNDNLRGNYTTATSDATKNSFKISATSSGAYAGAAGSMATVTKSGAVVLTSTAAAVGTTTYTQASTTIALTNLDPASALGKGMTINGQAIEFYDGSKGAYTGNATGVDLKGATTAEDVRDAIVDQLGSKLNGVILTSGGAGNADLVVTAAQGGEAGNQIKVEDGAINKQFKATLQVGANQGQQMNIDINDMRSVALGITSQAGQTDSATGAKFISSNSVTNGTDSVVREAALDVSSATNATNAIKTLNNAIEKVSAERSKLGAFQNRLEHTIANLGTSSENLTAAESRIRDVDMAKEMMNFSKNNILSQAAQAMLAQANSQPQGVLQLLR